jgi:Tfp pilus assembly protein PilO
MLDKYVDKKITWGNILNAVVIIISVVIFVITLRSDVKDARNNIEDLQHFNQNQLPAIYMRQDIFEVEIRAMRNQLDRIEQKLDEN